MEKRISALASVPDNDIRLPWDPPSDQKQIMLDYQIRGTWILRWKHSGCSGSEELYTPCPQMQLDVNSLFVRAQPHTPQFQSMETAEDRLILFSLLPHPLSGAPLLASSPLQRFSLQHPQHRRLWLRHRAAMTSTVVSTVTAAAATSAPAPAPSTDNPKPRSQTKTRKRASKACLSCRARKVRCDVSQRGRPCMNCYLDSETCVVTGRASR